MTNTTTSPQPLAEQVKAKIVMYEEAADRAFNNGASERGMRYDARVYELEQVMAMIDQMAKELEAKRKEADKIARDRFDEWSSDPTVALYEHEVKAYNDALTLLIGSQKKE